MEVFCAAREALGPVGENSDVLQVLIYTWFSLYYNFIMKIHLKR